MQLEFRYLVLTDKIIAISIFERDTEDDVSIWIDKLKDRKKARISTSVNLRRPEDVRFLNSTLPVSERCSRS